MVEDVLELVRGKKLVEMLISLNNQGFWQIFSKFINQPVFCGFCFSSVGCFKLPGQVF